MKSAAWARYQLGELDPVSEGGGTVEGSHGRICKGKWRESCATRYGRLFDELSKVQ